MWTHVDSTNSRSVFVFVFIIYNKKNIREKFFKQSIMHAHVHASQSIRILDICTAVVYNSTLECMLTLLLLTLECLLTCYE
jgi:hypothetical protein